MTARAGWLALAAALISGAAAAEDYEHTPGERAAAEVRVEVTRLEERVDTLDDRLTELEAALEQAEAERDAAEAALVRAEAGDRHGHHGRRGRAHDDATFSFGGTTVQADEAVDDAVALTGPVDVYGLVRGDAVSIGGPVRVHDGARVLGDAVSIGGRVEIAEGAVVEGDRVAIGGLVTPTVEEAEDQWARGLVARTARRIAALLSLAAAGVLLLAFWPKQLGRMAELATERPFWHGLAGLVLSVVTVMTSLVLTITIIGIPIAGALGLLLSLAWLAGFVSLCLAIGERVAQPANGEVHWRTFLVGVAIVAGLSLIPVLGPLVLGVMGLIAVGAALVSRFGNRMDPDAL